MKALLVDLDDTLYDYLPAHRAGVAAVLPHLARALGTDETIAHDAWNAAKQAVKVRLGATASSHSRLLYFAELVQRECRIAHIADARAWDRAYWSAFLDAARLRDGALDLLRGFRARGGKIAIVTDLTLEVQLWKLERFGLIPLVDAIAASEEVPRDKPAPELFELAMKRLGVDAKDCAMIGDHAEKDGVGARALGIAFHRVASSEHAHDGGLSLREVARILEVT